MTTATVFHKRISYAIIRARNVSGTEIWRHTIGLCYGSGRKVGFLNFVVVEDIPLCYRIERQ